MTDVTLALRRIHERIAAAKADSGRESCDIRLVAVSKTHAPAIIERALAAGQRDFGENYLQEAVGKIRALAGHGARWHFIGRIQSNKTADIAQHFDWVQTVDRERVARRLDSARGAGLEPLNVCLQIRLADDPNRPGVAPQELPALAASVERLPRLRLRGLMCMPPLQAEAGASARHFDTTREHYERLRAAGHALDTLSMGTTGDLEAAVAAGSTMIRVGTAIFGVRQRR